MDSVVGARDQAHTSWGGLSNLPAGVSYALALAGVVVVLAGISYTQEVFTPAFLALSMVVTVRPLSRWLASKRVPGVINIILTMMVLYFILIAMLVMVGMSITALVKILPKYSDAFLNLYHQAVASLGKLGLDTSAVTGKWKNLDWSTIASYIGSLASQVSAFSALVFLLIMVIAFLVVDMNVTSGRRRQLQDSQANLLRALEIFSTQVRAYWVVTTVFGLIVAALNVVSLWIIGIPLAITWGVLAFVTNYIPNIGFILGLIPPTILALAEGGPWRALAVIVAYFAINFVVQSIIQPKFTGNAVGLNTTVSFLSLVLWASILGGLGALLAVPLTLFFKAILIDSDPRSAWIGVFLRDADDADADADADGADDADADARSQAAL